MIKRRRIVMAAGASLLVAHRLSLGQPAATIRRVGLLTFSSEATSAHLRTAFRQGMQDLGWVEGKNVEYRFVYANGEVDRLDALAGELVGQKVDVIVVGSSQSAAAAHRATKTVPIVLAGVANAVGAGLVASLAKPGGNVTGMQLYSPETMGKRLQLLQEVVPGLRRVAVLRGVPWPRPGFVLYRDATDAAATTLDIRARFVQFEQPEDLDLLFEEMVREREQTLLVWSNPHVYAHRKQIYDLTIRHRLPAIYDVASFKEVGLLVYAAKIEAVLREAATYVDRILKGANAGDLPIGQPKTFELIINLKIAKALGLTIPQSLLRRADEVIQ